MASRKPSNKNFVRERGGGEGRGVGGHRLMKFVTVADEAYKFYLKTISLGGVAPPSLVVYGPIDLSQTTSRSIIIIFVNF